MTGIVCIWPYTIATIPGGWHLCDGTHGTIDMRGYVAIGARAGFDSGAVLGSDTHNHSVAFDTQVQNQNHDHNYSDVTGPPAAGAFSAFTIPGLFESYDYHGHPFAGVTGLNNSNHDHSINDVTAIASSRQLSREILFIMKL